MYLFCFIFKVLAPAEAEKRLFEFQSARDSPERHTRKNIMLVDIGGETAFVFVCGKFYFANAKFRPKAMVSREVELFPNTCADGNTTFVSRASLFCSDIFPEIDGKALLYI